MIAPLLTFELWPGLQGIDDLCLKYFVEAGAMAVRRVAKEDLKRIAKATGATMALTLSNMEGEEAFDSSMLGYGELGVSYHQLEQLSVLVGCTSSHQHSVVSPI